jgi:hypothetical protein
MCTQGKSLRKKEEEGAVDFKNLNKIFTVRPCIKLLHYEDFTSKNFEI